MRRFAFALAAAGVLIGPASASAAEEQYFDVRMRATGSVSSDYGMDRFSPGDSRGTGRDGKESSSFEWEVKSVAAGDDFRMTAAQFQMEVSESSDAVDWLLLPRNEPPLSERPACPSDRRLKPLTGSITAITYDGAGFLVGGDGDWVRDPDLRVQLRGAGGSGGFEVELPGFVKDFFQGCHKPGGEAHSFGAGVLPEDAKVRRGDFNPASDRKFSKRYTIPPVTLVPPHGNAGPGFATEFEHTSTSTATLDVTVKAISEKKAAKRVRKYRGRPRNSLARG